MASALEPIHSGTSPNATMNLFHAGPTGPQTVNPLAQPSPLRIQIVSDLHLEHDNPIPELAVDVDAIVVAGDLGPIKQPWLLREAVEQWQAIRHILYVPGNHEFYGSDIDEARQRLTGQCRLHGVTLLDRHAVTIQGVRFIGATLWTDFRLDGVAAEPRAHLAALTISDFDGAIKHRAGGGRFTTAESVRRHAQDRAFIERELRSTRATGTTTVVITHHAPTPQSVAPQFETDARNGAFASDLEGLMAQYRPVLWIHGHMHDAVDVVISETRVLCNPAGYHAAANERYGYNPQLCVEMGAAD